jgi:Tfp pilus assembly protein FimT
VKKQGFTQVEILIVVFFLMIIAAIIVPFFNRFENGRVQDSVQVEDLLEDPT